MDVRDGRDVDSKDDNEKYYKQIETDTETDRTLANDTDSNKNSTKSSFQHLYISTQFKIIMRCTVDKIHRDG